MNWWEGLLLGLVQGLTEFLPVSSSGHLALGRHLLGIKLTDSLAFDVAVHAATLLVVFIYFFREIVALFGKNRRVVAALVIGSLPAGVVGLIFGDSFEALGESSWALAGLFVFCGLYLYVGERAAPEGHKSLRDLSPWDALLVGLAQAVAIAPGVSRSGTTIVAARIRGLNRQEALSFSFLLSLVAVGGATLIKLGRITTLAQTAPLPLFCGFGAAFASGLAAVWLLARFVRAGRLGVFAPYLLFVGLLAALKGGGIL